MKSTLFRLVVGTALGLGPVQAMYDAQEEDKATLLQTKAPQQSTSREKTSTSTSFKEETSFESLPDELFSSIFSFLDIRDLGQVAQVSTRWKRVTEDPILWRYMGSRYYGDYLSEEDLREDPKQQVISHYLSVIVNMTEDTSKIDRLVRHYKLNLYTPRFKQDITPQFLFNILENQSSFELFELFAAQGNNSFQQKIWGLTSGSHGYEEDPELARKLNEILVERGDQKAIERKIEGLTLGRYGYKEDLSALRALRGFNELLVEKGNEEAIVRKMDGLLHGKNGYEKDLVAAREFNDLLIEKGDSEAIKRKMVGLLYGKNSYAQGNGYEKDLVAAKGLNESLVEKGDSEAIIRKIEGLLKGENGYEKDPELARKLNEILVERGDQKAIERKIEGLERGRYGYEKNLNIAKEFIEMLIKKGNTGAIDHKIISLEYGSHGDERNPDAAREFNETLIEKGDNPAIKRKIQGLSGARGYSYGYKKNLDELRRFYDFLADRGDEEAMEKKIIGLALGNFGYEKNPDLARELNEILVEKGNLQALIRKIKALTMGEQLYIVDSHYYPTRSGYFHGGYFDYRKYTGWKSEQYYRAHEYYSNAGGDAYTKGIAYYNRQFGNSDQYNNTDSCYYNTYEKYHSYGYISSPKLAKTIIEELISSEFPSFKAIGYYFKAFAWKYGVSKLGYEKEYEKAIEFIKQHHIPY